MDWGSFLLHSKSLQVHSWEQGIFTASWFLNLGEAELRGSGSWSLLNLSSGPRPRAAVPEGRSGAGA